MSEIRKINSASDSQPDTLPAQRSEKFVKVYANAANIEVTAWDFNILFGEIKKSDEGPPMVEYLIGVTMSPQHAKALAGVLLGNVREYEKQVGEIKLPTAPNGQTNEQSKVPTVIKS